MPELLTSSWLSLSLPGEPAAAVGVLLRQPAEPTPAPIKEPPNPPENPNAPVREPEPEDAEQI